MHRAFERSRTREATYLDGRWEFVAVDESDGERSPIEADDPVGAAFAGEVDRATVPGCWQTRPRYHDHHGVAWYRREFHLSEASHVRLRFEAVALEATVYVDGREVCGHVGGFTPFETVLENLDAGDHEIAVRVDSERDETTVPKPESDWFPYGGITREAFVERLPDVFVDDLRVEYDLDGDDATVETTVAVRNLGDEVERSVGVRLSGPTNGDGASQEAVDATDERTVEIPQGTSTVSHELTIEDVDRWSTDEPVLYEVVATVDDDDLRDRIGFREVEVEGRDVLLNGEPVEFVGVNRHEDHPEWGHAQPARLMDIDIDLLERGGFNTVRTSHYPNHPRFLDYCDEAGLLVIEEIPYWQFDAERFARGELLERGERMLTEMIDRDYHRPSVVAWSLHNECGTDSQGVYEATERLARTARDLDGTRPLTYATYIDFIGGDERCDDLVDFLCFNAYWGWYDDARTWPEFLSEMVDQYEMPLVVSEFGAGAVAGERTFESQKWSESYQADLLVDALEAIRETDGIAGFTIWQYCDTRTQPSRFDGRPKTKNNKGILTEYRRPKDAFLAVSEFLDE